MPRALTLVTAFLLIRATTPLFANNPFPSFSLSSLAAPADTDAIYLDTNGKKIRGRNDKKNIDKQHAKATQDRHRGKSNSITKKEAGKTEGLIREGRFSEAWATGNLLELWPLKVRQADWRHVKKDDFQGGKSDANNREYGISYYDDGDRIENAGETRNPCNLYLYPEVTVEDVEFVITNTHSHPSGTRDEGNTSCSFGPQPPSKTDISAVPKGSDYWTVFAMGDKKVYLYNNTGVIAVLKIKRYIR